jgi:hypothetical protein
MYFIWFHTTKPFAVKENWQKTVEKIFCWFESKGITVGDPESLKDEHQEEQRKTVALKSRRSQLFFSERLSNNRLKTRLTITL